MTNALILFCIYCFILLSTPAIAGPGKKLDYFACMRALSTSNIQVTSELASVLQGDGRKALTAYLLIDLSEASSAVAPFARAQAKIAEAISDIQQLGLKASCSAELSYFDQQLAFIKLSGSVARVRRFLAVSQVSRGALWAGLSYGPAIIQGRIGGPGIAQPNYSKLMFGFGLNTLTAPQLAEKLNEREEHPVLIYKRPEYSLAFEGIKGIHIFDEAGDVIMAIATRGAIAMITHHPSIDAVILTHQPITQSRTPVNQVCPVQADDGRMTRLFREVCSVSENSEQIYGAISMINATDIDDINRILEEMGFSRVSRLQIASTKTNIYFVRGNKEAYLLASHHKNVGMIARSAQDLFDNLRQ